MKTNENGNYCCKNNKCASPKPRSTNGKREREGRDRERGKKVTEFSGVPNGTFHPCALEKLYKQTQESHFNEEENMKIMKIYNPRLFL